MQPRENIRKKIESLICLEEPDEWQPTAIGILGHKWKAGRFNPCDFDERLNKYYPSLNQELTVYVAGSNVSVNEDSLGLACEVINSLYLILGKIQNLTDWNIVSFSVPHQLSQPIIYINFQSEYDGELYFSCVNDQDSVDSWLIKPIDFNRIPPEQIPVVIEWALEELIKVNCPDSELIEVVQRIFNEKIQGSELLATVKKLYLTNREFLSFYTYNRIHNLLEMC